MLASLTFVRMLVNRPKSVPTLLLTRTPVVWFDTIRLSDPALIVATVPDRHRRLGAGSALLPVIPVVIPLLRLPCLVPVVVLLCRVGPMVSSAVLHPAPLATGVSLTSLVSTSDVLVQF